MRSWQKLLLLYFDHTTTLTRVTTFYFMQWNVWPNKCSQNSTTPQLYRDNSMWTAIMPMLLRCTKCKRVVVAPWEIPCRVTIIHTYWCTAKCSWDVADRCGGIVYIQLYIIHRLCRCRINLRLGADPQYYKYPLVDRDLEKAELNPKKKKKPANHSFKLPSACSGIRVLDMFIGSKSVKTHAALFDWFKGIRLEGLLDEPMTKIPALIYRRSIRVVEYIPTPGSGPHIICSYMCIMSSIILTFPCNYIKLESVWQIVKFASVWLTYQGRHSVDRIIYIHASF